MSFKTLFTAVDVHQDDTEIERAMTIAGTLDAHLMVLVVGVAPPPPASPYGVVSNDVWAGDVTEGQEVARTRAQAILDKLGAAGCPATVESNYVDRGTIATITARFARYSDLTLIFPSAAEFQPIRGCVSDGALFESGRPIVLLPEGKTNFPQPERVMLAWDASVEASKAAREAIGLMQNAKAVDAVLVDPVPTFDGHGPEPGADLAAYLARHGISATVHCLPREGRDVSETLEQAAQDLGSDLIVMGGYGHSRLRQRIFGGTTTNMLKGPKLPVLMAH